MDSRKLINSQNMKIILDPRLKMLSSYPVGSNLKDLKRLVNAFTDNLTKLVPNDDRRINIICRGSSGAMLASGVANKLDDSKRVIINHVKKEGEYSHNQDGLFIHEKDYVVMLDDFTVTGSTLNAIHEKMIDSGNTRIDLLMLSGNIREPRLNLFNHVRNAVVGFMLDDDLEYFKNKKK